MVGKLCTFMTIIAYCINVRSSWI